jgi:DNA-binding transcriptional MerR regulator
MSAAAQPRAARSPAAGGRAAATEPARAPSPPRKPGPAPTHSIGELAREFGLTTRAIRFYEDCGLLRPRRAGSKRIYTAGDRVRLTLTLRGKRLGLKLAEVKDLLDMYDTRRDSEPQLRRFLDVLARHRAQLEERLADVRRTLDEVLVEQVAAERQLKARSKR